MPDLSESDITDKEALERAIQGDSDAFSLLYERHINRIFNYIFYRTGSVVEAEDLTARVFHRALKHISTYRHMGVPFSAWLYRIAHNLVANWYRDRGRKREVPLDDYLPAQQGFAHPESAVLKSQEQDELMGIIRKLSPERQQLLILKYVEGLSNAEIGEIMGRSEGAIKGLYHRTLVTLRKDFEKD